MITITLKITSPPPTSEVFVEFDDSNSPDIVEVGMLTYFRTGIDQLQLELGKRCFTHTSVSVPHGLMTDEIREATKAAQKIAEDHANKTFGQNPRRREPI